MATRERMRKLISTDEFIYRGRSYPGIPLFCSSDAVPVTVLNRYMLYLVVERGRANSPGTWNSHANALLDYFSWLETNGLEWDQEPRRTEKGKEASNLALYQYWSQRDYRKPDGYPLSSGTINQRVTCVQAFYAWARDVARLIEWLPYCTEQKSIPLRYPDPFAHAHGRAYAVSSTLKLPVKKRLPRLLSLEQCRDLLGAPMSSTLRTMTRLMLATGLRNAECRTYPRKYVFDPSGLDRRKRFRILLDPLDMKLKGDKERAIYLSWHMMKSLFDYRQFGEGVERAKKYKEKVGVRGPMLFLNDNDEPWSEKGLNNAYRKLWAGFERRGTPVSPVISFRITPHMLRNTYATLELYHEASAVDPASGRKKGMGHALAWVRDRLGHSSIQTTTVYVHCLDALQSHELNAYQEELDEMLAENAHGA